MASWGGGRAGRPPAPRRRSPPPRALRPTANSSPQSAVARAHAAPSRLAYPRPLRRNTMPFAHVRALRALAAFVLTTLWGTLFMSGPISAAASTPKPPVAEKRPHEVTLHGERLTDDYAW